MSMDLLLNADTTYRRTGNLKSMSVQVSGPSGAAVSKAHHMMEDAASQCSPQSRNKRQGSQVSVFNRTEPQGESHECFCSGNEETSLQVLDVSDYR